MLNLNTTYPTGTDGPSSDYPYGAPRNASGPETTDGFRGDYQWSIDIHYAFYACLMRANVEPNNVPENVNASQFVEALDVTYLHPANGDGTGDIDCGGNALENVTAVKSPTATGHPIVINSNTAIELNAPKVSGDFDVVKMLPYYAAIAGLSPVEIPNNGLVRTKQFNLLANIPVLTSASSSHLMSVTTGILDGDYAGEGSISVINNKSAKPLKIQVVLTLAFQSDGDPTSPENFDVITDIDSDSVPLLGVRIGAVTTGTFNSFTYADPSYTGTPAPLPPMFYKPKQAFLTYTDGQPVPAGVKKNVCYIYEFDTHLHSASFFDLDTSVAYTLDFIAKVKADTSSGTVTVYHDPASPLSGNLTISQLF